MEDENNCNWGLVSLIFAIPAAFVVGVWFGMFIANTPGM